MHGETVKNKFCTLPPIFVGHQYGTYLSRIFSWLHIFGKFLDPYFRFFTILL